jgi:hypothetical protein
MLLVFFAFGLALYAPAASRALIFQDILSRVGLGRRSSLLNSTSSLALVSTGLKKAASIFNRERRWSFSGVAKIGIAGTFGGEANVFGF